MEDIDMSTEINEIMNNEQVDTNTNVENEADKKAIEEDTFNLAVKKLNSYGLEWTFRSINYVLNKENVSFGQLRSCVYMQDGQGVFDYIKSTMSLIKAGLVGSKQISESNEKALEDRAYEIIEDWRNTLGFIGTLHLLIIHTMEEKHFFMGTVDQAVLNHLSSKNSQTDLVKNLAMEDLEEKIRQAQALSSMT